MENTPLNPQQSINLTASGMTQWGPRSLVEERDACGVGFVADQQGRPSFKLVQQALGALGCMEHRGGCCADKESGDGAGIMTAIPWALLQAWAVDQNIETALEPERTGVAMVFLPPQAAAAAIARESFTAAAAAEGFAVLGWREVPVEPTVLGVLAKQNQPRIEQFFVHSDQASGDDLERELYRLRRRIHRSLMGWQGDTAIAQPLQETYICSFSSRTIVYKGMVRSEVLSQFYRDLQNADYVSPFAIYHRRFSTNTMPKWPLAHPMRLVGHNGEINTLVGNINWMKAREADLSHPAWAGHIEELLPIVNMDNSDSANLDGVMELLVRSGRSPLEALMIMVPEAYRNQPDLEQHPEITDFYDYYSGLQEPWDGPALIAFGDGKQVAAALDRNGLRPARYIITSDGLIIVSSEAGVVDVPIETIVEKGRLGPGQVIAVDFQTHEILKNWDIKQRVAAQQPYGDWLAQHRAVVTPQLFTAERQLAAKTLMQQQAAFGYTAEDVEMIIQDMAAQAKEPTYCMGDDIPLAVLSTKAHLLYDYFKQRFAQVTNPPIDPLRERLVMSLETLLGQRGNLLEEHADYARLLKLESPVLNEAELQTIRQSSFKTATLSTLYDLTDGPAGLQQAIQALCDRATEAVRAGSEILILSDRPTAAGESVGLTPETTYIPPLVATGAVHHHLIRQGLRMQASLVVDTAQCWSTHHFACLIGYGASAICPYLALESVRHWWHDARTQKLMETQKLPAVTLNGAQGNYRQAVENGLLKILSKMGISLITSYQGAQIFEAVGIGPDLLEVAFRGTT
ncbi:MAG: glutamate synthase central domain-containing protein, partial [Cyanobacteria bacterium P01_A01_bin.70]